MAKNKIFFMTALAVSSLVFVLGRSYATTSVSAPLDKIYQKYTKSSMERLDDSLLLRRLSLHLTGSIPSGGESMDWLKNPSQDKFRELSIRYLKSAEFAEYWGTQYASLFREMTNRRKEVYGGFYKYLVESVHEDKPYDVLTREMLTAKGSVDKNPAVHFYARDGADPLQVAEYVGRVFYARMVGCSRCHDDKFDPSFTQRDYYALAAFFGQQFYVSNRWDENKFSDKKTPHVPRSDIERLPMNLQKPALASMHDWQRNVWNKMSKKQKDAYHKKIELEYGRLYYEPNLGIRFPIKDNKPGGDLVVPKFLDGSIPKIENGIDRREVFVDWLVDQKNPRFRKVIVNRIWKHFMGWAFFEPLDDWNKNTVIQGEEILNHLDEYFYNNNHSIKSLIYYIVNSNAYARRNPKTDGEAKDVISFYPSRRMDPDQLMNSVVKGLYEVEQPKWIFSEKLFSLDPNQRIDFKGRGTPLLPVKGEKKILRASQMERPPRPNQILAIFGGGPRTDVADDHNEITIEQVLTLMNGRFTGKATWEFGKKDSQAWATFEKTKSMEKVMDESFVILLGRNMKPNEKELLKTSLPKGDSSFQKDVLQDWIWAILNSQEFLHVN